MEDNGLNTQKVNGGIKQQRTCGILGGLSYVSTAEYYNKMNELVGKTLPGHSSRIHIVSLNVFTFADLIERNEFTRVTDYLMEGIRQLIKSGIDFLIISSNTAHIVVPQITQYYPDLFFLHIGDAIALPIKQQELKKIGFLGTKFATNAESSVVQRLIQHGLSIVFPSEDDISLLHKIIATELTCNVFTTASKEVFLTVMQRLYAEEQVEGIVLGCTEIPLLVNQSDMPNLPLFDSTELHIKLAVDFQLGHCSKESFLPSTLAQTK